MFSIEDLTKRFNALDSEGRSLVFEQLTRNADFYNKIMPNTPLILYILGGEKAVPPRDHGPIINSYKVWLTDPSNQAKLKN
jgi:hypothetical protein